MSTPPPPSQIHLEPLTFSSLPAHPALDESPSRPHHTSFLTTLLTETRNFLNTTVPSFTTDAKPHPAPPSTANVQLSSSYLPRAFSTPEKRKEREYWVCRKSRHANKAISGSASYQEFRKGLRTNHSEHEMEYTPTVSSVEKVLEWETVGSVEGGWRDVSMHVNVITHTFNPLISPRTFTNLIITADNPSSSEFDCDTPSGFITVQIPLTLYPTPSIPHALRDKIIQPAPKNTIFAAYASVEQVRLDSNEVEWTMATTSDARGAIPQWIQRSWTMGGVPKAVVADVGLFIGWVQGKRSR